MLRKVVLAIFLAFMYSPLASPPAIPAPKPFIRPMTAEKCLAWVIHDEARGEPLRGARAVLDTVLARMKKYKKGACQIVSQKRQFSGYRPGVFYEVGDEHLDLYEKVVRMKPVARGCTHFHAKSVRPGWADKLTPCGSIGNHKFYKEKRK